MRKDLETGEKTQIKSYADFKEWKNNIQVMINIFLWIINFLRLV